MFPGVFLRLTVVRESIHHCPSCPGEGAQRSLEASPLVDPSFPFFLASFLHAPPPPSFQPVNQQANRNSSQQREDQAGVQTLTPPMSLSLLRCCRLLPPHNQPPVPPSPAPISCHLFHVWYSRIVRSPPGPLATGVCDDDVRLPAVLPSFEFPFSNLKEDSSGRYFRVPVCC